MNARHWMIVGLLLPWAAQAGTATLTMTPPTKNTDGSALLGPATCNVFGAIKGQTKALLASGVPCTTWVQNSIPDDGRTMCYDITVSVVGETDSAHSTPEACKDFPKPQPQPGTVTVAQNVYQKQGGKRVLVGRIALKVACGNACGCTNAAGQALSSVPRYRVTFTKHDNGTQTLGICA